MDRLVYLDLFSGASGDMLLGALVDAGLPLGGLRTELQKLPLSGYELHAKPQLRHGISGTKLDVRDLSEEYPARHLSDVRRIVTSSSLSEAIKATSLAVFQRLAEVEARIHGSDPESVHFHELSAVDSIVDVVGFVAGLDLLDVSAVFSAPVPLGSGTIHTAHGEIPVPAPATLALLAEAGAPTRPHKAETEIVTPTAAALVTQLAQFRRPAMRVRSVGYGFGTKEFEWANALRIWLGDPAGPWEHASEGVVLVECNLDDTTGETLGYVMDRLFEAGALDVWFTAVQMKKNRPGVVLSVLVVPEKADAISQIVLRETTTLGVRLSSPMDRIMAERRIVPVRTPWGDVRVKEKWIAGERVAASPEYEDCAKIARHHSIPLQRVVASVRRVAETGSVGSNSERGEA
jgi:uncharacterized protein (TIGR00299 family) protein